MRPFSTVLAAAVLAFSPMAAISAPAAAAQPAYLAPSPYAVADLGAYHTFAFFEAPNDGSLPYAAPLTREMVQATRKALEQRGYVYDEKNPELRVNLFAMVVERRDLRVTPVGPAFAGRSRVDTVPYLQGTFVIDLVDARHQLLVWRGMARGHLTQDGLLDPAGAIQAAVRGIFSRYPATAR